MFTPTLGSVAIPLTVNLSPTLYAVPSSRTLNSEMFPSTLTLKSTLEFVPIPDVPEIYSNFLLKYGSGSVTSINTGLVISPPLLYKAICVVIPASIRNFAASIFSITSNPENPCSIEEAILLPCCESPALA